VHSAAAYAPYGPVTALGDADWDRVLATGPTGAMRLVRAVLPAMRARGFGRIVLVGSLAGTLGAHGQLAYAAAKAALAGLARTAALEGGRHGVTANVVELGPIDTPRVREAVRPEIVDALAAGTAVGRLGTVDEVAAVVGFLCSADAGYVTGAVIPVGGGLGTGVTRRP
jgi:NAD(P)-dependent dehydrogenase (short-subunit alcohol dehydrogenase family)